MHWGRIDFSSVRQNGGTVVDFRQLRRTRSIAESGQPNLVDLESGPYERDDGCGCRNTEDQIPIEASVTDHRLRLDRSRLFLGFGRRLQDFLTESVNQRIRELLDQLLASNSLVVGESRSGKIIGFRLVETTSCCDVEPLGWIVGTATGNGRSRCRELLSESLDPIAQIAREFVFDSFVSDEDQFTVTGDRPIGDVKRGNGFSLVQFASADLFELGHEVLCEIRRRCPQSPEQRSDGFDVSVRGQTLRSKPMPGMDAGGPNASDCASLVFLRGRVVLDRRFGRPIPLSSR